MVDDSGHTTLLKEWREADKRASDAEAMVREAVSALGNGPGPKPSEFEFLVKDAKFLRRLADRKLTEAIASLGPSKR
jgi:hypothetical protein